MFRISALILALLLACAPFALAESESLISQELIKADKVNYKTETVAVGAFERTVSASAEEFFPNTYSLSFNENGARFGRFEVIRGREVKAGDVLATLTLESDEVELTSLKMQLEDAREALQQRIADDAEADLERQRAILAASDPWERDLLILQSQRAELALEQYQVTQNRAIARLEEKIAEINQRQESNAILSPSDGVIIGTSPKREGERVYSGEILMTMYRTDGMLMRIQNDNGFFRYGMDVILEVGSSKERTQLPGRIVGADTLIPTGERTGYAYVEVEIPENLKLVRPTISATTISVQDVPMVARNSVTMEGGLYYVTTLADGVPQKRFINCAVNNSIRKVWVLQGLEPGEEIIID